MGPVRQAIAAFVFLRRIARGLGDVRLELKRMNELKELELEFSYPQHMRDRKAKQARAGTRKPMEFGVGDPKAWSEEWRKSHPEDEEDDLVN